MSRSGFRPFYGERHTLKAGDAMLLPSALPHEYENLGRKEVRFYMVLTALTAFSTLKPS